jgi:hypothetical protein
MAEPVLVRSSTRTWDHNLLLAAGAVFLVGGSIGAVFGKPLLCILPAVAGVALMVWAVVGRSQRAGLRRWVQDQGDGFLIIDPKRERRLFDRDVLAMALARKSNYSEGILKSETRKFRVWLPRGEAAPEAIEMTNKVKVGTADPLAGLIDRIGNLLFERAKEEFVSGQAVLGECWTLDNRVLTVRMGGAEASCPLEELTATDVVDRNICVWRRGQDEAFARVPVKSANAYVLPRLLTERLAQQSATDGHAAPRGLGRVLFERRPRKATSVALFIFGALLLAPAPVLAMFAGQAGILWEVGSVAVAGIAIVGGLHACRATFRCHQHGVYKAGLFRGSTLRYSELASFSYSSMRHYHHGAYTGTNFRLSFEPEPGQGARRIVHSVHLPHADQELEKLRDQVSQLIAARMSRRLAAREPVRWTKRLRFLPDGIEFHPRSFFGRKAPVVMPFADVASYEIRDGRFMLWAGERKKPVIRESTAAANFYPGYHVLSTLLPLGP